MDSFPTFQWKIDIHDDECYETTVSGSFGPFNTLMFLQKAISMLLFLSLAAMVNGIRNVMTYNYIKPLRIWL
jgi:hypothetical protein